MTKPTGPTYPSRVLEERLRFNGVDVRCMWELKGPKDTNIAWVSCFLVNNRVVLVETYKEHNGWDVFTACGHPGVDETVADVMSRCACGPLTH